MKININNEKDLIEFVNRPDVSKEDALKAAEKCLNKKVIVFINRETGELTFSKEKLIKKITGNKTDRIWIM